MRVPVVDLFAGAGGLAEGFASLVIHRSRPFLSVLSIEKDRAACDTLRLRSFFRKFRGTDAPEDYYRFLRGEMLSEDLYGRYPRQAASAHREVWQQELGSANSDSANVDARIKAAISHTDFWVLAGGPPCQAYSTVGRSRNRGVKGYVPENDQRHFVSEYLRILGTHQPSVFVMENVKGILYLKGERLLSFFSGDTTRPIRT